MLTALGILAGVALFILANLITAGATSGYRNSRQHTHEGRRTR